MSLVTVVMIGFVCGVAAGMMVVAIVALWYAGKTIDQVQGFDDLEGEGRG